MNAIKLTGTITLDRKLSIDLPQNLEPGVVEVLILQDEQSSKKPDFFALLADLKALEDPGKSLSVLNERIEKERASWE